MVKARSRRVSDLPIVRFALTGELEAARRVSMVSAKGTGRGFYENWRGLREAYGSRSAVVGMFRGGGLRSNL